MSNPRRVVQEEDLAITWCLRFLKQTSRPTLATATAATEATATGTVGKGSGSGCSGLETVKVIVSEAPMFPSTSVA